MGVDLHRIVAFEHADHVGLGVHDHPIIAEQGLDGDADSLGVDNVGRSLVDGDGVIPEARVNAAIPCEVHGVVATEGQNRTGALEVHRVIVFCGRGGIEPGIDKTIAGEVDRVIAQSG